MTITVLYFAALRAHLGRAHESLDLPASAGQEPWTAAKLADYLQARGSDYAQVFADDQRAIIRVAINQDFAAWDSVISHGDEVAFFPPVTGG